MKSPGEGSEDLELLHLARRREAAIARGEDYVVPLDTLLAGLRMKPDEETDDRERTMSKDE